MHEKHLTTRAIVLKAHQLRESDLILTILTEDHGKLSALARGARRSKKRFMGGIDLFDCALFELEYARNNQHLLHAKSLSAREIWLGLRANLSKLALASYCVEITNHLIPEGDADGCGIFWPLRQSLLRISNSVSPIEPYVHAVWFTLILLQQSGLNPLNDRLSIKVPVRSWWESISSAELPTIPENTQMISESFLILLNYVEKAIGQTLHTHSHFAAVNER